MIHITHHGVVNNNNNNNKRSHTPFPGKTPVTCGSAVRRRKTHKTGPSTRGQKGSGYNNNAGPGPLRSARLRHNKHSFDMVLNIPFLLPQHTHTHTHTFMYTHTYNG